jgi:hypothetical protein
MFYFLKEKFTVVEGKIMDEFFELHLFVLA